MGERSIELKLCSENCSKLYWVPGTGDADLNQQIYILTPDGKVHSNCSDKQLLSKEELQVKFGIRCAPALPMHEEMLHLYSTTITSNQWHTLSIEEISFCRGDITGQECRYAVYHKRGLLEQPLSLEFFISQNLEPTQLLPYCDPNDEATNEAFDILKTSSNVQHLLATARIHISCEESS